MKITVNRNQISLIAEEVVADGNAEHNPYAKKWKAAKDALKSYLFKEGSIMTSKESGKEFIVMYDLKLSNLLGIPYCYCASYDKKKNEITGIVSVKPYDVFTLVRFNAEFDTRGRDNIQGTADDLA